ESFFIVKLVSVEHLVRQFSLEILAGDNQLHRTITKTRTYRPGLEFIGYFDFFPMEHVQVLGRKEITYLHQLSHDERDVRIGNVDKYYTPCLIGTSTRN